MTQRTAHGQNCTKTECTILSCKFSFIFYFFIFFYHKKLWFFCWTQSLNAVPYFLHLTWNSGHSRLPLDACPVFRELTVSFFRVFQTSWRRPNRELRSHEVRHSRKKDISAFCCLWWHQIEPFCSAKPFLNWYFCVLWKIPQGEKSSYDDPLG